MTAFTLAHFSDPHLPFEPVLTAPERFSKRALSALSWQRKRRRLQSGSVLGALRDDVLAQQPDHIAITGDITNFSLPGEFAQAADWLRDLGEAERVSLVPGNHDALVAVAPAEGLGRWRAWTRGDQAGGADWPWLRVRGEVALIGLNSALPTPPLMASGRLGEAQLARLEVLLREQAGRFRIVLVHHPVAEHAIGRRKALRDRAALRAVLARAGCELVLHGHARDARFDLLPGSHRPILCLGLPSASAIPNPEDAGARWHSLGISADAGDGWILRQHVRCWDPRQQRFVPAGNFQMHVRRDTAPATGDNA